MEALFILFLGAIAFAIFLTILGRERGLDPDEFRKATEANYDRDDRPSA